MKKVATGLLAGALVFGAAAVASAEIIYFEDFSKATHIEEIGWQRVGVEYVPVGYYERFWGDIGLTQSGQTGIDGNPVEPVDGNTHVLYSNGANLLKNVSDQVGTQFIDGHLYTLSMDIGWKSTWATFPGYEVQLLSFNGSVVSSYASDTTVHGDWNNITLPSYLASNDADGTDIWIKLINKNQASSIWQGTEYPGIQVLFDNINLDDSPPAAPAPLPATVLLFGSVLMGLVGLGGKNKKYCISS